MIGILQWEPYNRALGREEMHPYPRLRRYFPRWGKSALRLPYC